MRPPLGAATGSGLVLVSQQPRALARAVGLLNWVGGVGLPHRGCGWGTGAAVSAGSGINKYCPSRTVRLPSKLFHSAKALTVTLYRREMVNAVSPRTTLWRMGSMPSLFGVLFAGSLLCAFSIAVLASSVTSMGVSSDAATGASSSFWGSATIVPGQAVHPPAIRYSVQLDRRRIQTRGYFANGVPVQCFYNLIGGIRDHTTFICNGFRTRCVLRSLGRVILPAAQVNVEIIHVATRTDARNSAADRGHVIGFRVFMLIFYGSP